MFAPGVSTFSIQPQDIGLILSYQCQSHCKHCVYNCGTHWEGWMAPETVYQALQAALQLGSVKQVHITGGEPFLNFPLLLAAVEMSADLHLPRYVETNAGWCIDPHQVEERFYALDKAGLNVILISCSPFHAETIPLTRTLMAIDRALDVFGPRRVIVHMPDWIDYILRYGTRTPTPIYRYIESYGIGPAGVMLWEGYGLLAGGRAGYNLGYLTTLLPAYAFVGESCLHEMLNPQQSQFDLYGNFIPGFCSGLSLGSWQQMTGLLQAYADGQLPALVKVLLEDGPYGLFELARLQFGYTPIPEGYAGKCHLCVDVRRHLARSAHFSELEPAYFYETLVEAAPLNPLQAQIHHTTS